MKKGKFGVWKAKKKGYYTLQILFVSVSKLEKGKEEKEEKKQENGKGYKIASKEEFEKVLKEELEKRKEIYMRIARL